MQKIPRIGLISLGCAKNLVDTERLTSVLIAKGYQIEANYEDCDLIVVNTCGFISPAVEESLEAIGQAVSYAPKVIVTGCLGAKAQLILKEYPQVAAVYGPGTRASVLRGIRTLIGEPPQEAVQHVNPSGILLTPPHYAYLKIAEGCRHRCAFCIIPSLRGPLRSRNPDDIYKEASDLTSRGVKELLIIAQDSSDYGFDLKNQPSLSQLCKKLASLKRWLRIHYVYPSKEANKIVELMADNIVLPYLDVPLQHASERILKQMRRPGNTEKMLATIENWRKIRPDIAIRSTFITGFPGETEEDFSELLSFIKEAKLDRVGCFPYSDVDGAAANDFPNPVPLEIREERAAILMETQEQISREKLKARIGKVYDVVIDTLNEDGIAVGRSKYEAPDVDGIITIHNAKGIREGDIVKVEITASDTHDLQGELCSNLQKPIPFSKTH